MAAPPIFDASVIPPENLIQRNGRYHGMPLEPGLYRFNLLVTHSRWPDQLAPHPITGEIHAVFQITAEFWWQSAPANDMPYLLASVLITLLGAVVAVFFLTRRYRTSQAQDVNVLSL